MMTLCTYLFNASHLGNSDPSYGNDQIAAKDKTKPEQTNTFAFNGNEYPAAPKPHTTMIPIPRIG